jgi:uncharacterized protein (DUF1697 family)
MSDGRAEVPRYIAFLRAVNITGRFVKMELVRKTLEASGFDPVETHIQSGNLLVGSPMRSIAKVETAVGEAVAGVAGFAVVAIVRTPAQLRAALEAADGIPRSFGDDGRRYLVFCAAPVAADAAATLNGWQEPGECAYVLGSDVVMELGLASHQVKLTNARIERLTGAACTTRDLKVVRNLVERWS